MMPLTSLLKCTCVYTILNIYALADAVVQKYAFLVPLLLELVTEPNKKKTAASVPFRISSGDMKSLKASLHSVQYIRPVSVLCTETTLSNFTLLLRVR